MSMETSSEEHPKPKQKIGFRHVQVFLLFTGMAIAYTLRVGLSVAIVAMKNENPLNPSLPVFHWDTLTTSTILSSFFWGYVLSQIPAGQIASTGSASKLLSIGIFLCSVFNAILPFSAKFGIVPVICCRVLMGFTQGCLMPCTQTLLSRWVPPLERSCLGSFVINGCQFGIIVSMPLAGLIADSSLGWPYVFYFFSTIGIIWGIAFYWMSSDHPSEHPTICPVEANYITKSIGGSSEKPKVPWKSLITSLPTWTIIITHSGYCWGYYTLLTFLPSYMKSVLNFDIAQSGIISGLPYLAMWLLCFPISYVLDLSVKRGLSIAAARKISNTIGLWIPAVAMVAICFIKTQNKIILVGFFIVAVGFQCGCSSGFQINHIDLSPNFAGPMMSLSNGIGNIFGIIAPIACGHIVTDEKNELQWHLVFLISAGVYFSCNLIFILFGQATIQPWNEPKVPVNNVTKQRNRVSIVSLSEPVVLVVSDEPKEKIFEFS